MRNHDPLRKRKLLLNRRELDKLVIQTQQKGLTIVPMKIYFRDGIAKCELAVAKGKKFHDRRESERQKEAKREADEFHVSLAEALNPEIDTKGRHADPTRDPAICLD